jgi:hypothetical protein
MASIGEEKMLKIREFVRDHDEQLWARAQTELEFASLCCIILRLCGKK